MAQTMGAREAHSQKIRTSLFSACSELLALQPIDAITINQIVETAGVAKGSFYNHFSSKEALASAISNAIRQEIEEKILQSNINITDPAYKIARGVSNYIRLAVRDSQRAIIVLRAVEGVASADSPLNVNIQIHVEEGIASGRFAARSEKAGMLLILGITSITMSRIIENRLTSEESIDLGSEALTLLFSAFGLPEEEARRIAFDSARDIVNSPTVA